MEKRKCEFCNKEFETENKKKKFCCRKCQNRQYYRKHKREQSIKRQEYQKKNKERLKQNGYRWRKDNKKIFLEQCKKWNKKIRLKYPEKIKAHHIINNKLGKIPNGTICEICKVNLAKQRHHPNYSKPLEIKYLCITCHHKIHKGEFYV